MSVRKTFVKLLHEEMRENDNIVFVVGDLGYGHLELSIQVQQNS